MISHAAVWITHFVNRTKIDGQLHKLQFEAFHPVNVSSQGNWVYEHPWL